MSMESKYPGMGKVIRKSDMSEKPEAPVKVFTSETGRMSVKYTLAGDARVVRPALTEAEKADTLRNAFLRGGDPFE